MLKRLYIHNFKSFYHSHFEFGKLNCLIAPNNTGKSNLIEAIEFIDNLLFKLDEEKLNFKTNFRYQEKNTVFQAEFEVSNRVLVFNELIDYKTVVIFDISIGETNNIDVNISGSMKSIDVPDDDKVVGYFNYFMLRAYGDELVNTIKNYSDYSEKLDKKRYSKFNFQYNHTTFNYILESNRNTQVTISNLLGLTLNNTKNIIKPIDFSKIFGRGSIFESHYFHSYMMKERQIMPKTSTLDKYGTNLISFISGLNDEIIEDISTSLIGEVEQVNGIEISDEAHKRLYFIEDEYKVPLEETSDGTVHFIAIMSAILGNKNSVALMIEEPERHMHMKVLSTIVETMRADSKQIFFTTHSGELLKVLNQNEIIFLYRDEETADTKSLSASKIESLEKVFKTHKYDITDIISNEVLGYIGDYNVQD